MPDAPRQTLRLLPTPEGIRVAAEIIRAGGLVAFPTETVYGLGANALDASAVGRIFVAKRRPADDPLIVHIAARTELARVAHAAAGVAALADRFWPGPLTLVLRSAARVPGIVTAGRHTVGVRVPAHPVAQALLAQAQCPIAAPSANLFSHPSPTRPAHVLEDLGGRIDAILEDGPTSVGLESTIVDLTTTPPRLLRPGGLPTEEIEAILGGMLAAGPAATSGAQPAPGLLASHYAPVTSLALIIGQPEVARARLTHDVRREHENGLRVGVLCLDEDRPLFPPGVLLEPAGTWADPRTGAARLFDALRALDRADLSVIYARELADPAVGLGRALADRLRRAAARIVAANL